MAYAVPVVTDATASSEEELREAAGHFLPRAEAVSFTRTSGGVNNRVYYVDAPAAGDAPASRYILRIYNNGLNTPRVRYEHAVLEALRGAHFSFAIPRLRRTLTGELHAMLASGAAACMFDLIPGGPATLDAASSIGAATAELLAGMQAVRVVADIPCPNPLYRNIYEAHHKITREIFFSMIEGADFDAVREPTSALVAQILRCEELVKSLTDLPEQQIHADLHFDNVLAHGGAVTGVLDFEFTAYDWRAMEMAVGLSKYVGMKGIDINECVREWVDGYARAGGRLTAKEIQLMPDFIILRILSNVVYFAGRAAAGEDLITALTSRVRVYADRCAWLEANRAWLVSTLTERVLQ